MTHGRTLLAGITPGYLAVAAAILVALLAAVLGPPAKSTRIAHRHCVHGAVSNGATSIDSLFRHHVVLT